MLSVKISEDLLSAHEGIYLACRLAEVSVKKEYDLDPLVREVSGRLRLSKEGLKDHPVVRAFRDFYWRIGIDPTKTRPASEALARRLLGGQGIPKINSLVDAGNLASVETMIPIGVYDFDKVMGGLTLRFAREGE